MPAENRLHNMANATMHATPTHCFVPATNRPPARHASKVFAARVS